MIEGEIYAGLTSIIRDALMQDDLVLTPDLTADQVEGWDSFKMIEIIMAVESHFDIEILSKQFDKLKKVGDLAFLVEMAKRSHA